jgi:lactoylglutathione lyase
MLPFNQIAIGTDDVYKTAEAVKICGGQITREPGPLPGISTKITACVDPDGWKTVSLKFSTFLFVIFLTAYEIYQLPYLYIFF